MLINHDQAIYLPAAVAPQAFALAAQRYPVGVGANQLSHAHARNRIELLGNLQIGDRRRGISVRFFGAAVNDAAFDYRLWAVYALRADDGTILGYELNQLGSGTATFGTLLGGAAGVADPATADPITSAQRFADTITWAAGRAFNIASTLFGAQVAVDSPGDNTIAAIHLTDVGPAIGVLLEIGPQNGANVVTNVNAIIEVRT